MNNNPEWFLALLERNNIPEHAGEKLFRIINNSNMTATDKALKIEKFYLKENIVDSDGVPMIPPAVRTVRTWAHRAKNIKGGIEELEKALKGSAIRSTPTTRRKNNKIKETDPLRSTLEVNEDNAKLEVNFKKTQEITDDVIYQEMKKRGMDPKVWSVTGFRSSEWSIGKEHTGVSLVINAKKRPGLTENKIKELAQELATSYKPPTRKKQKKIKDKTLLIGIADLQIGKMDGGESVTAEAVGALITKVSESIEWGKANGCEKVHCSLLGDCIEGFVSQKGNNAWRTKLTTTEQLSIVRALFFAVYRLLRENFDDITIASVPGNHGEPQRFGGAGVTRYDDSHDTDCLTVVSDAAKMAGDNNTKFQIPENDELTVISKVGGIWVVQAHGHKIPRHKGIEWWKGQAFGNAAVHDSSLLLTGHAHHFNVQSSGDRLWVQCPALESESTWWRHQSGDTGYPGIVGLIIEDDVQEIKRF